MESTTVRMEKKALETLTKFAKKKYLDRGTYMRQLLMKQLQEENMTEVFQEYQEKRISLEQVATKTNKSILEILDIMKQRNLELNVSLDDIQKAISL